MIMIMMKHPVTYGKFFIRILDSALGFFSAELLKNVIKSKTSKAMKTRLLGPIFTAIMQI